MKGNYYCQDCEDFEDGLSPSYEVIACGMCGSNRIEPL